MKMKYLSILILIMILSSGCVSDGGKWIEAKVHSKNVQPGGMGFLEDKTEFRDHAGNIYISTENEGNKGPKAVSICKQTELNKNYLIHIDSSGNVNDIVLGQVLKTSS